DGKVIVRRDFLPFGESLDPSLGGRAFTSGYISNDSLRQKFTGYERDDESGLDFAQARHFNGALGRFMQVDEFSGGPEEFYNFAAQASQTPTFYANPADPQSLNKYQYCYNNPLLYTDTTGHQAVREFFDSLATTYVRDRGSEKVAETLRGKSLPEVTSKAGAFTGHALAIAVGTGELIGGVVIGTGGAAGGVVTSPSGVGAVAGAVVAAGGAALATDGLVSLGNTVNNLLNDPIQSSGRTIANGQRPKDSDRKAVYEANKQANNGKLICEDCDVEMVKAGKSQKGVKPPSNEASIDHKQSVNKGGDSDRSNLRAICRGCNRKKSDK
ncbi:MAG: HNH endonuclease, partial [Acidobacteria bacterium]|nr:HNH endonuclease [Acidobacteriota bacterium]